MHEDERSYTQRLNICERIHGLYRQIKARLYHAEAEWMRRACQAEDLRRAELYFVDKIKKKQCAGVDV